MRCPNCKYEENANRNWFAFVLGANECKSRHAAIVPGLMYELALMFGLPLIAVMIQVALLRQYPLFYYVTISVFVSIVLLALLYNAPIRAVINKEYFGQRILFGPTRPPISGPLIIFGFGSFAWVI